MNTNGHWEPIGHIDGMQVSRHVDPALEPTSSSLVTGYPKSDETAVEVYPELNGDINLDIGGHDELSRNYRLSADDARDLVQRITTALDVSEATSDDEDWLDLQMRYADALWESRETA